MFYRTRHMTAVKEVSLGDEFYRPGEPFYVTEIDRDYLVSRGKAEDRFEPKLARRVDQAPVAPPPPPADPEPVVVDAPPAAEPEAVPADDAASATATTTRRPYTRRATAAATTPTADA